MGEQFLEVDCVSKRGDKAGKVEDVNEKCGMRGSQKMTIGIGLSGTFQASCVVKRIFFAQQELFN